MNNSSLYHQILFKLSNGQFLSLCSVVPKDSNSKRKFIYTGEILKPEDLQKKECSQINIDDAIELNKFMKLHYFMAIHLKYIQIVKPFEKKVSPEKLQQELSINQNLTYYSVKEYWIKENEIITAIERNLPLEFFVRL